MPAIHSAACDLNKFGATKLSCLALGAASLLLGAMLQSPAASALPAFARQTGQPCATCHTAFPELTPYGRAFKLGGYTAGGTRCGDIEKVGSAAENEVQIPLSVMTTPVFTHVQKALPADGDNDNATVQQTSLFVAGQIYCDLGAFVQTTYDRPAKRLSLDNTDIRYANATRLGGIDVRYGLTANNNPTVQDVWNTTPAWSFPYLTSEFAPAPAASTMIEGTFASRVGGVGAYVWVNNMVYAEFTAYGSLPPRTLTTLGVDPSDGTPRFAEVAPYGRLAVEKTWDRNSLMAGAFAMLADVQPTVGGGSSALAFPVTDPFTDVGVDTEYQYIGDIHDFTFRASYIWERQKLNGEFGAGSSSNNSDELNSFRASASYVYDKTISVTGGYFNTWGTPDVLLYTGAGFSTGSPNSDGWIADLAYLPFSRGGPALWPWFNARIGISYTHYNRFDGSTRDVDQTPGRSAQDNDTTFLYAWFVF